MSLNRSCHGLTTLPGRQIQNWIHPFSAGFGLIARHVGPLLAMNQISWITHTLSSICPSVCLSRLMEVAKGYGGGQGSLMFCTRSRSGNPLCATTFCRALVHPSIFPHIHAHAVQVHPPCLFLSTCLQVPFLLHFTSSNSYFSMCRSVSVQTISAPLTHRL